MTNAFARIRQASLINNRYLKPFSLGATMVLSKSFINRGVDPRKGDQKKWKRKWRLLFIFLGLLVSLPVILTGRSLTKQWESRVIAKTEEESLLTARLIARNVGLQVDEYARAVEMLARQVEAWGTLEPFVLQKIVTTEKAAFPGLALMYVGSADGFSIAVDPPFDKFGTPNAGTDYRDRDYYQEVLRTGKTFIGPARMGRVSHVPNIQIAAPIWDTKGQFIAFTEDAIDVFKVIPARVEDIVRDTPEIKVVVLDREGRTLAHPDKAAIEELRDLSKLPLFQPTTKVNGELRRGIDETGAAVHAAVVPVLRRNLNWQVVAYRTEESIKGDIATARPQVWIITTAALLTGVVFTALAIWLRRKNPSAEI
ncbi:hypothetical protein EPO44_04585 [bacterium]|nr:MAG: hypothetical protein EPO44_04585 [bacterium]